MEKSRQVQIILEIQIVALFYGNMQLFDARADKRGISAKVRDNTSHLGERFQGIFCMR
jgi:hypothetical protein